jgi:gliding motility-associated-like protein
VEFYTHPDGDIILDAITGVNPICLDDDTDVDIEVTAGGVGPFTAYYTQNGSQTTGNTPGSGLGTVNVIADTGTVVLDSIVDVNGCVSTINESITITAHDTLIVDVQTTCTDDAGTATPNDGYTVTVTATQSTINTVSITSGTITNASGTWTSSIINEGTAVDITVTDINGCNTVVVSDIQRTCSCPTVAELTHLAGSEACAGDLVTLVLDTTAGATTSSDFTASITGPTGTVTAINIAAGGLPHQFTVADSGIYTLTVFTDNTAGQGGGSCDAQLDDDTALVHIYSLPTAELAGGSESCIGSPSDPITINVTGAGSSWDVDYTHDATANNTTVTTAGESTLVAATSTAADSGTYTLTGVEMTVGSVTCTATDLGSTSPEIVFSPAQGASIDSDVDICKDSSGTLTATDEGGGVTYSWVLNGTEVGTGLTHDVTNAAGVYTLTTKKNGCADQTATATVSVTEIIVTAFADPVIVSEGDNITFSTTTNGISCEWFDPSLNSIGANCTETYAAPAPGGLYTVVSTDGNCVGTDQIDITVIQPIKVPDAFTPNGDDVNDNFTIIGIDTYDGATVSIYNRWGNLVYYMYGGENYANAQWDGKLNGKELPAGVYFYTVDLGLSIYQSE